MGGRAGPALLAVAGPPWGACMLRASAQEAPAATPGHRARLTPLPARAGWYSQGGGWGGRCGWALVPADLATAAPPALLTRSLQCTPAPPSPCAIAPAADRGGDPVHSGCHLRLPHSKGGSALEQLGVARRMACLQPAEWVAQQMKRRGAGLGLRLPAPPCRAASLAQALPARPPACCCPPAAGAALGCAVCVERHPAVGAGSQRIRWGLG